MRPTGSPTMIHGDATMNKKAWKVAVAIVVFGAATAISVMKFRAKGVGIMIDGALLLGLFYYLSTLGKGKS